MKFLRTASFTVHENIVRRNGKKHSHVKFSHNYLRSPTQADHILWRPQYWHVFFILLSCFSGGKFEKTLVNSNVKKPGLFIF